MTDYERRCPFCFSPNVVIGGEDCKCLKCENTFSEGLLLYAPKRRGLRSEMKVIDERADLNDK